MLEKSDCRRCNEQPSSQDLNYYLDFGRVSSRLVAEAGRARPKRQWWRPLCPGSVAGLVRVPLRLAVVAEAVPAARPLARNLGTGGATYWRKIIMVKETSTYNISLTFFFPTYFFFV